MTNAQHLVAILHSLPRGSGDRTRARVEIARRALECTTAAVVNLYPARLVDVNAMVEPEEDVWALGRAHIAHELGRPESTDVLLGFGVQVPSGHARRGFRRQIEWLSAELDGSDVRVWAFGGRPTHPSRWQRVVHRHSPGGSVDALAPTLLSAYSLRANGG